MRRYMPILMVIFAVLLIAEVAHACPNCAETIATTAEAAGDGSHTREGFFWSILFMMAMPFLLLGTGIAFFVRAARRGAFPEL